MKRRKLLEPEKKHRLTDSHPAKDSFTRVEPIRKEKDINLIKKLLADNPRNYALFTVGINFALRGGDLLSLKVKDVEHINVGESFQVRESKTKKKRTLTMNRQSHDAIQSLLKVQHYDSNEDYLFQSQRKGSDRMTIQALIQLIKKWCQEINLRGNYGSHTLRKTWGFMQRTKYKVSLPVLMTAYGHSSQSITMRYLCIQDEEVEDCYMNEL